jgi:hypothetical protein
MVISAAKMLARDSIQLIVLTTFEPLAVLKTKIVRPAELAVEHTHRRLSGNCRTGDTIPESS